MNFEQLFQEKKEQDTENQIEKPKKLYRGMRDRGISSFDPNDNTAKRDPDEEQLVFATPDRAFATMFLVPEASDSWTMKSRHDDVWVHVIADEELYKELDMGGCVYEIDDLDHFDCDSEKGVGASEWTSDQVAVPSSSVEYVNSVDAMIEGGVQVYFVDIETFIKIKCSKDFGACVLQDCESENQKRGQNVKDVQLGDEEKTELEKESDVLRDLERFHVNFIMRDVQVYMGSLLKEDREIVGQEVQGNADVFKESWQNGENKLNGVSDETNKLVELFIESVSHVKNKFPDNWENLIQRALDKKL